MKLPFTLEWEGDIQGTLRLLDQRALPLEEKILEL